MKFQKAASLLIELLIGVSLPAAGQGFVNFDFESATIQERDPRQPNILVWELAVPGWRGTTDVLYYQEGHLGSAQLFMLADSTSSLQPLSGSYSVYFHSGFFGPDPQSNWISAAIWQTGTIPVSARSIQLLARGPLRVELGGVNIPMFSMGGNMYAGDIVSFAGQTAQLTIFNNASVGQVGLGLMVDNIFFSPVAIPEPASLALVGLGGALWILRRRKT